MYWKYIKAKKLIVIVEVFIFIMMILSSIFFNNLIFSMIISLFVINTLFLINASKPYTIQDLREMIIEEAKKGNISSIYVQDVQRNIANYLKKKNMIKKIIFIDKSYKVLNDIIETTDEIFRRRLLRVYKRVVISTGKNYRDKTDEEFVKEVVENNRILLLKLDDILNVISELQSNEYEKKVLGLEDLYGALKQVQNFEG